VTTAVRSIGQTLEESAAFVDLSERLRPVLTEKAQSWLEGGVLEDVLGQRLYVRRRDGDGPLLILLHGFPSSSYDWRELLELRPTRAALALDFLGFGLSAKPRDHVYSLSWQADAVAELVRRQGSPPVFLVGHDMGTSVATELMARDLRGELDFRLAGALLFNGSMLLHLAKPTVGQRLLRSPLGPLFAQLTTARTFRAQFARVFAPDHPLSAEEAADQWSLISRDGGQRIAHKLVHYMEERERFTDRWHGALRDWPGPLTLTWGLLDPVARTDVLDGLRALRPGVETIEIPEAAHYPQIECPERIAVALDVALASASEG
jgi:pimeloyl-ACP methyl ester carboxylesterase